MKKLLLTDTEAAVMLGYDVDLFRRIWRRLVLQGMPAPGHRVKRDGSESRVRQWDRLAIMRWLERRRPPHLREQGEPEPAVADRHKLDVRLRQMERAAGTGTR